MKRFITLLGTILLIPQIVKLIKKLIDKINIICTKKESK